MNVERNDRRIEIRAYHFAGHPSYVTAMVFCTSKEARDELASKFPKSLRLSATTLGHYEKREDGTADYSKNLTTYMLDFRASLYSNEIVGEKNEAGIKRYRRLVAMCEGFGFEIALCTGATNSYLSREEFEAAL